jgi:hypothetical protein
MVRHRRPLVVLVAAAFLLPAAASALPAHEGCSAACRPLELFAERWAELAQPLAPLLRVSARNGAEVDANGTPTAPAATPRDEPGAYPENGAKVDPDG